MPPPRRQISRLHLMAMREFRLNNRGANKFPDLYQELFPESDGNAPGQCMDDCFNSNQHSREICGLLGCLHPQNHPTLQNHQLGPVHGSSSGAHGLSSAPPPHPQSLGTSGVEASVHQNSLVTTAPVHSTVNETSSASNSANSGSLQPYVRNDVSHESNGLQTQTVSPLRSGKKRKASPRKNSASKANSVVAENRENSSMIVPASNSVNYNNPAYYGYPPSYGGHYYNPNYHHYNHYNQYYNQPYYYNYANSHYNYGNYGPQGHYYNNGFDSRLQHKKSPGLSTSPKAPHTPVSSKAPHTPVSSKAPHTPVSSEEKGSANRSPLAQLNNYVANKFQAGMETCSNVCKYLTP